MADLTGIAIDGMSIFSGIKRGKGPIYATTEITPDITDPVISNFFPTSGSFIGPTTNVTFTVTDNRLLSYILVYYVENGIKKVIFKDGVFQTGYITYSSVSGAPDTGYNFSVRPDGGWPTGISIDLNAEATDSSGNTGNS